MADMPKTKITLAFASAAITFLVFLPALQNDFIMWDDNVYVYENLFIRSFDARLLTSAFTELPTGLWHPLTWISHALDYAVWGLNPLGHHLTSNIIHALNVFIIVLLTMRLLEVSKQVHKDKEGVQPALSDRAVIIAGVTAGLLFGIHPLRVESVAWVSERKDLLSAFFYLLTIAAYSRYIDGIITNTSLRISSRFFSGNYLSALGLFILALMSKPMAVSLPVVLFILDWHPYKRIRSAESFRMAFIEKMPFIILSLAASIVTLFAQGAAQAVIPVEITPVTSRLALAVQSVIFYLVKTLAPVHLVPLYLTPLQESFFSVNSLVSILIVVIITISSLSRVRKQKLWISAWGYYVITLVPVLGIVQVGAVTRADRFTYLPSLSVFLVLGLLAAKIHEKISERNRWGAGIRMSGYAVALTVAALFSAATISQIGIWKDSITFWTSVTDAYPDRFPIAYNNLGFAYAQQGRYDEALKQYATAINLNPGLADPHNNSGMAYAGLNRFDEAINEYALALAIQPRHPNAHNNLGSAYLSRQRYSEAINEFTTALILQPDFVEAHYNLGNAYAAVGYLDQAIGEYRAAIALDPNEPDAHKQLGDVYSKQNRLNEAAWEYRVAESLR
jgi:tetratricopeptide (TPR) repeat protein